ncbi:MAG: CYTH domain-containing protein [Desulfobacteraceae bacterium]
MGIEIERKFLLKNDQWRTRRDEPLLLRQGYIQNSRSGVVRIRTAGTRGFITVKGETRLASRLEYEYEIPLEDAGEMLEILCEKPLIEKKRFSIEHRGFHWVIDEFSGENQGLVVAELELTWEDQPFEVPPWLGREVTCDPKYLNANLIKKPYCRW